jgi:hypothetical protein
MIGSVAFMWVIGWIIKVISNNRKAFRMASMQAELQSKLLDKFGSSPELLEFLQSDASQGFAELVPAETRPNPYDKILWSVQAGVVLLMTGLACMFLRSQISEGFEAFTILGALGIALGVGFLLSAAIAFLLSKKWGVINGDMPPLPERV